MRMTNNPFSKDVGIKNINKDVFETLLDEYEKEDNIQDCLSLFLKNLFKGKEEKYHIKCGSPITGGTRNCSYCHICRFGKYSRENLLDFLYRDKIITKRGNKINR